MPDIVAACSSRPRRGLVGLLSVPGFQVAALLVGAIAVHAIRKRRQRRQQHTSGAANVPPAENDLQSGRTVSDKDWEQVENQAMIATVPTELPEQLLFCGIQCTTKQLLHFLFRPGSRFLTDWATACELRNVSPAPWNVLLDRTGAPWQRTLYYDMPLRAALGPPVANTTETQVLEMRGPTNWCVRVVAATPNVPFGQRFCSEVVFMAFRATPTITALRVTAAVTFNGAVGLLRGTIHRATISGMHKTYDAIERVLQSEFGTTELPATMQMDASLQAMGAASGEREKEGAIVMATNSSDSTAGLTDATRARWEAALVYLSGAILILVLLHLILTLWVPYTFPA